MTDPPRPIRDAADVLRRRALDVGRLFLLCALVGVIAGLGAAGFHYLLQLAKHLCLDGLAGYRPAGPLGEAPLFVETARPLSRWVLFVLPAAGGLVSGLIVWWLAPEAEGHGTDAAIDAYHHRDGAIRARVPFVKALASAITMGTGGSAGREGPIAQIGAGLASNLAQWLGLSARQQRILMASGMAAGIGAIFHAPLAGALFAAEVLYREIDLEYDVVAPAILASIIAYSTFGLIFGWRPLFETPEFVFTDPRELAPYLVLALVVAFGARVYVQVFYGLRDLFRRIPGPPWIRPALGGLVVGAIGLVVPQALSTGFGVLQGAFLGKGTVGLLFAIAAAKILTTSFTVGSGGSGGVFGPAVVIGGSLGGGVGLWFHALAPRLVPAPGAFALVGMAGFFAAAANVPISTVIMVSEMTGNYHLLVPSMFVCTIGFLLVRRHTIYEKQLPTRADSPAHQREMMRTSLERLSVDDLLAVRQRPRPEAIPEDLPLAAILERLAATGDGSLPVKDAAGRLIGLVTLDVVQHTLGSGADLGRLVIARDLAVPVPTVTREQNVYDAVREMLAHKRSEVVVVESGPDPRVVAVLTSGDVNSIYEEAVDDVDREARTSVVERFLRHWRGRR
ncbi:MAG: chloride channel protein [Gemmatimonadales bacterium]|nr:chloride channel protein [Gemmatimonadales bacterium]